MDLGVTTALQKVIPLPVEQLRLVLGVLLCLPLSLALSYLRGRVWRLWASTLVAFCIQFQVLGYQACFLWIQVTIVYVLCRTCDRGHVGRYVVFQSFGFLSLVHLRRYLEDTGVEVDVTAILMMSTCKFIMFGFCYQDGGQAPENLGYPEQNKFKIQKLPSPQMYLGYVQFLPSCLVGPAFEYRDYSNYLDNLNQYSHRVSTLKPALIQLVRSLACSAVYIAVGVSWKVEYLLSKEYKESSFVYQGIDLMILMFGVRMKYYAIWSLSMSGIKASGLSYQQTLEGGELVASFQKIQAINITNVQMGSSFKVKIDNWNISVQQFLKRYVYQRLYVQSRVDPQDRKASQQKSQSATIILSAFWHGFFPSYIMSFIHWMLVLQISQQLYRLGNQDPKLQSLYTRLVGVRGLCTLVMNFYFSYYGVFFVLFSMDRIWLFSKASLSIPSFVVYISYYLLVMRKREPTPKTP